MPRSTLVGRIEQLIQDAGCQLLYLPPYSPDLNKIEQCWSWLKSQIRKKLDQCDCLRDARNREQARLMYPKAALSLLHNYLSYWRLLASSSRSYTED